MILAKSIAIVTLLILSFITSLGNYWFVFGIWPRSWTLFVVFCVFHLIISGLIQVVGKAK
jgi:uncharacterized SAM-binding protein YcdF (DUF218 family)